MSRVMYSMGLLMALLPLDCGAMHTHMKLGSFSDLSNSVKRTLCRYVPRAAKTPLATISRHTSGTFFVRCRMSLGSLLGRMGGTSLS